LREDLRVEQGAREQMALNRRLPGEAGTHRFPCWATKGPVDPVFAVRTVALNMVFSRVLADPM